MLKGKKKKIRDAKMTRQPPYLSHLSVCVCGRVAGWLGGLHIGHQMVATIVVVVVYRARGTKVEGRKKEDKR